VQGPGDFRTRNNVWGNSVQVEDQTLPSNLSGSQLIVDPDYQLARYRERRTIVAPIIYGYADLVSYSLNVVKGLQDT
jgi:hypothetical protein